VEAVEVAPTILVRTKKLKPLATEIVHQSTLKVCFATVRLAALGRFLAFADPLATSAFAALQPFRQ
jgi:hypothetical protein